MNILRNFLLLIILILLLYYTYSKVYYEKFIDETTSSGNVAEEYSISKGCINSAITWKFVDIKNTDTKLYKIPKNVEEGLPKYYPQNTIQNNTEVYYFKMSNTADNPSTITMKDINKQVLDSMTLGFYINGGDGDPKNDILNILKINIADKKSINMSYIGNKADANKSVLKFELIEELLGEEAEAKRNNDNVKGTKPVFDETTIVTVESFNIGTGNFDSIKNKNWIVLKLKIEDNKYKLSVNNNNYNIDDWNDVGDIESKTGLNITDVIFSKFNGYIGRIMLWNTTINDYILCSYYQCYKNYADCSFSIKDTKNGKNYSKWLSWGNKNADKCIQHCYSEAGAGSGDEETCTLHDCQELCLKCDDNTHPMKGLNDRVRYCPWFENSPSNNGLNIPKKINISSFEVPDNLPDSIILTWNDNNSLDLISKITHYVLEIKESFTNQNYKIILLQMMIK